MRIIRKLSTRSDKKASIDSSELSTLGSVYWDNNNALSLKIVGAPMEDIDLVGETEEFSSDNDSSSSSVSSSVVGIQRTDKQPAGRKYFYPLICLSVFLVAFVISIASLYLAYHSNNETSEESPEFKDDAENIVASTSFDNFEVFINAGSFMNYTDPKGREWLGDSGGNYGNVFRILGDSNTFLSDDHENFHAEANIGNEVYATERYFTSDVGGYWDRVHEGEFLVTLHFAELFFGETDKRLFHVFVEDSLIFEDYDIVRVAGARNATHLWTTQSVIDGGLIIRLERKEGDPKISGIEVKRIA